MTIQGRCECNNNWHYKVVVNKYNNNWHTMVVVNKCNNNWHCKDVVNKCNDNWHYKVIVNKCNDKWHYKVVVNKCKDKWPAAAAPAPAQGPVVGQAHPPSVPPPEEILQEYRELLDSTACNPRAELALDQELKQVQSIWKAVFLANNNFPFLIKI